MALETAPTNPNSILQTFNGIGSMACVGEFPSSFANEADTAVSGDILIENMGLDSSQTCWGD